MQQPDPGAPALFRAVGLQPDGPAILGRPIPESRPGVYVVELSAPLATAPIELTRVGKWIEEVPTLRLDGERPTSKALVARLASFWLPSRRVLYIGATESSIGARVSAVDRQVLGERRPHAASQWLKTLRVSGLRVWWATTDAPEEYEDGLLAAFAESVPPEEAAALFDTSVIMPFANQRRSTGEAKRHGVTGSVPPAEPAVPPLPTHVVDLPPADADGARPQARGTGTTRRAPAPRAAKAAATRPAAAASRAPRARKAPVLVSADGLDRMEAELGSLVARRPEVVARIRAAKELGDLKENSDYHAAREEQGFLEGRIQALEAQLRVAVVPDAAGGQGIGVGSTVTVEIDGEQRTFSIVGTADANAGAGRISYASPIGAAMLGHGPGDEVVATTPGGSVAVRIVEVDG